MNWQEKSNCLGIDPNLFHPLPGETDVAREAYKVCSSCRVQEECLMDGIEAFLKKPAKTYIKVGIRAGMSEKRVIKLAKMIKKDQIALMETEAA